MNGRQWLSVGLTAILAAMTVALVAMGEDIAAAAPAVGALMAAVAVPLVRDK